VIVVGFGRAPREDRDVEPGVAKRFPVRLSVDVCASGQERRR
jgi:hypothetical protein